MTPLWHLAFQLWLLGTKFTLLQVRVMAVPVFGDIFAAPFGAMAGVLYDASSRCHEVNEVVRDIQRLWWDLRYGGLVNEIIGRVFYWWHRLRTDPRGFVNDWICNLFPGWTEFRHDPRGYILNKIYDRYPELKPFLQDPWGWLRSALEWRLGLGSGFFADPLGNIKGRIYARYPQLWGIFENPTGWLKDQLVWRLGVDREFLDDPRTWIWYQLRDAIDRNLQANLGWLVKVASETLANVWKMKT